MGRARAMMNFAGFTTEKTKQLWCEAANTATMLDDILVHEQNSAPLYTVRELDLAMCVSPSSNGSKMRSLWTNQMKS